MPGSNLNANSLALDRTSIDSNLHIAPAIALLPAANKNSGRGGGGKRLLGQLLFEYPFPENRYFSHGWSNAIFHSDVKVELIK